METDKKWGPVRLNHAVIGVGPLCHHKSSCWECSTDSITTKVKAKRVLALFLRCFIVRMERCVHMFNTVALFLLWFLHFGGTGNMIWQEYCLISTWWIVQWSQTKRCSQLTWGCFTIRVPNRKKKMNSMTVVGKHTQMGRMQQLEGTWSLWMFTGWL